MPVVVAGIGGVILGHIIWLIGVTMARASALPSAVVLLVSALFLLGGALAVYYARQNYRGEQWVRAAFLAGLAVSPVLLTIVVLGVTYL
ncbi:MAG: hypothetical protein ACOYB7_04285 [Mycobacterium sp.]